MKIPIFTVDAFSPRRFGGNPAAVCALEGWIYDRTLQAIAAENNLPATAFIVPQRGEYEIRWFTPTAEIELCGHATLASGYVVLTHLAPSRPAVRFFSKAGELLVRRVGDELAVALPRLDATPRALPAELVAALGATPHAVLATRTKLMAVFARADEVAGMAPDFARLARLEGGPGIIVTAPGDGYACDFVSRYFSPASGHDEDWVTGSAHCVLVPYWAAQLKKDSLLAKQISKRVGEMRCEVSGERVTLNAHVTPYLVGEIEI
jgi:PhzF family phenazine biosynthesis protein